MAADHYTVTYTPSDDDGRFAPAPEGPQQLVCADGIYLGWKSEQFGNEPAKLVEKYAFVYQTADFNPETGRRYEVAKEFTVSMHAKAGLRKFLSNWRGKAYSDEEAASFDLHKVVGANGIGSVEHKVSAKGRTYGVLTNITPLMKGMDKIAPEEYERGAYWETRKADYLAGAETFRAAPTPAPVVKPAPVPTGKPAARASSVSVDTMVLTPGKVSDALSFDGSGDEIPF